MSQARSQGGEVPGGGGQANNLHDMSLGKIVLVGAVSLAIFAAGIFWAYRIWSGYQNELTMLRGNASAPTRIGREEIGIVDQTPFSIDRRLETWRARKDKQLGSYGWVDRAKGTVHIPIEKAMQEVVAQPPDVPGEGVPLSHRAAAPTPAGAAPATKLGGGSAGGKP